MSTASSSYWCYSCSRVVSSWQQDSIVCPECDSGFLEEALPPARLPTQPPRYVGDETSTPTPPRIRRHRRSVAGDRSPFNPVIVLRGQSNGGRRREGDQFELYYDDGSGFGLRPLPPTMSEFLMGSGFERLLDQLAQIEMNGLASRGFEHPPAAKEAVESMPSVEISDSHTAMDCHCAVCLEAFDIGAEAKEMPCKHIYHRDCILPWLSIRNSCPICRHQMAGNVLAAGDGNNRSSATISENETVGLTIWRLPGGGFAVGRFSGGANAAERQLPVVFTEVDGAFNSGGAPRRIYLSERDNSDQRRGNRISRAVRNFFSLFGRRRSDSSARSSSSSADRQRRGRVFRFGNGVSSDRQ